MCVDCQSITDYKILVIPTPAIPTVDNITYKAQC
jgi:hypothetical protein